MLSLLLIAGIVIVFVLSRRLHQTVLSPWGVYVIAWLAMFLLYSWNWVTYISISFSTWVILIGSLFAYILGTVIVLLGFLLAKASLTLPPPAKWFEGISLSRYGKIEAVVSILGVIGAIAYFLVIERLFGLKTLMNDPGIIRASQNSPDYISAFFWWKFIFYFNWLAVPLALARIAYQGRRTPRWVYLALIFPLILNFTQVSRGQIILLLVFVAFILGAAYRQWSYRWEPFVIGLFLLLAVVYFSVAGEALGKTNEYLLDRASGFYGPKVLRPTTGFYIYVTGNIPGLQAYVFENAGEHTYGLFQFLPFLKILNGLRLISVDLPNEVGDTVSIPFSFNTYTYLNVFFKDWDFVGIVVGPFLFGLLGNWLYLHTCSNGKVWYVIASAIVVHASLSSIGTNVLISTPQWEYVALLIMLALVVRDKRRRLPRRVYARNSKGISSWPPP